MVRSKLIFSVLVITAFCAVAVPGFAKPAKQLRNGYGLGGTTAEGWIANTDDSATFTGALYVTGSNFPGGGNAFGNIECNDGGGDETNSDVLATYFFDGFHQGNFGLISTNGDAICDDLFYLNLDAQVTTGGALIKFNFQGGGDQVGSDIVGYGVMNRLAPVTPSGTYGFQFWGTDDDDEGVAATGYVRLATDTNGNVMIQSGEIDCNYDGSDYTSNLLLCVNCVTLNGDGTGTMFFTTTGGDDICDFSKSLVVDFVLVNGGARFMFNSNAMYEVPSTNRTNSGEEMNVFGIADVQ